MTRFCFFALVAVIAGFLAQYLGGKSGEADGKEALTRLQQVWPNVLEMPVTDRALLAGLAMTCHVQERPQQVPATIDCLRVAMASDKPLLPKGMDRETAAQRLDQLLADRP